MKTHYVALSAFLLGSFISLPGAYGFSRKRAPEPTPTPSALPSPAPVQSGDRILIGKITGATTDEVQMIHNGAALANAMLDKRCYKQWILAAQYTENNGMSQAAIFDLVKTKPSTINVEMYTGSWKANHISKTVGYENDPFDGVVHMNRYFVDTAQMVGDNLIHEDRGHSLGFHHYGEHSTSQPYGMNYAYEGCSFAQLMQSAGAKAYRPPGLRLEFRKRLAH